ncbi:MAG: cyclopropane-fatty-acyl-phospholipid synthase [Gammaproteobacteria bacterium]|nr:cyclopropane-fatty-acyl-phospholipid synthase [Gammaproteobacteria bacterium]
MAFTESFLRNHLTKGSLTLIRPDGSSEVFGTGEPCATFRMRNDKVIKKILRDPQLNLGETYMDGEWDTDGQSLENLLTVLRTNFEVREQFNPWLAKMASLIQSWNSITASHKNVRHHYNLDEPLFRSFLDEDMHYSCAYFRNSDDSLEEAQQNKCAHILKKLNLPPDGTVLDIGCGWGSLAMHIAENANAHVTGITLSDAQVEVARKRAKERQLENQVSFNLEDYRLHQGKYDAVVSVGMFEHVGKHNFETYFKKVKDFLKPNGVALIHTIGNYSLPEPTNSWIGKYIFPGGYIPALSEVLHAIEVSELVNQDTEVWRRHYAQTLGIWNERFQKSRERFVETKSEHFCRMWEFYLVACQTAFTIGNLVVFQLQLGLSNDSAPNTRDYLYV